MVRLIIAHNAILHAKSYGKCTAEGFYFNWITNSTSDIDQVLQFSKVHEIECIEDIVAKLIMNCFNMRRQCH